MKITTVYTEESAIGVATIWQKAIFTFRSSYSWKFHGFRFTPVMYDPTPVTILTWTYAWAQMTFGVVGDMDMHDGLPGYEVMPDADSNLEPSVNVAGTMNSNLSVISEQGFLVPARTFVTCTLSVYGNFTANTLGTSFFDLWWAQSNPFGK